MKEINIIIRVDKKRGKIRSLIVLYFCVNGVLRNEKILRYQEGLVFANKYLGHKRWNGVTLFTYVYKYLILSKILYLNYKGKGRQKGTKITEGYIRYPEVRRVFIKWRKLMGYQSQGRDSVYLVGTSVRILIKKKVRIQGSVKVNKKVTTGDETYKNFS